MPKIMATWATTRKTATNTHDKALLLRVILVFFYWASCSKVFVGTACDPRYKCTGNDTNRSCSQSYCTYSKVHCSVFANGIFNHILTVFICHELCFSFFDLVNNRFFRRHRINFDKRAVRAYDAAETKPDPTLSVQKILSWFVRLNCFATLADSAYDA